MNPYYDNEKLGLEIISFDQPDLSYEYNTLCFWATKDGKVYSASDSGCSCPTPFEDAHARETYEEVLQTLERVGSVKQAESIFNSWNKGYDNRPYLDQSELQSLTKWVKAKLKK